MEDIPIELMQDYTVSILAPGDPTQLHFNTKSVPDEILKSSENTRKKNKAKLKANVI